MDRKAVSRVAGVGLALGLAVAGASEAGTVYRWTDEAGEVHFSDRPPPEGGPASEPLELEPAPGGAAPAGDDYYSVVNQARRMQAQRLERERQEAEIEALQRRAAPPEPVRSPPPGGEARTGASHTIWVAPPPYWGSAGWPGSRPPHRPGWAQPYPPRPGHRPSPDGPPPEREPPTFRVPLPRR